MTPSTLTDFRWMVAYYAYGALPVLMLPLWPLGLVVDGVWCGLLRREAVVLPLISRLADLDAEWSTALLEALSEGPTHRTGRGVGADPGRARSPRTRAELRRIERDLHDGTQARLVSLSMRIGLAKRAYYDQDPAAARRMLDEAQTARPRRR
ncbi:histidine kinase [Streptomyces sp. L7]